MSKKFSRQYSLLGLKAPAEDMAPRDKADIIFHAACKKLGLDPTAGPTVHHLPERFQIFPVASYKLEVITEALLDGKTKDYNDRNQEKWGAWFYMNNPGFRFDDSDYVRVIADSTSGSRTTLLSDHDAEFFAKECIALWADFNGGRLPQ